MNVVKKEEEPMPLGFSATRLGLDKSLEKQRLSANGALAHEGMGDERH